jgi:hypothetical protein
MGKVPKKKQEAFLRKLSERVPPRTRLAIQNERGRDGLGKHKTGVRCVGQKCNGIITEERSNRYLGDPMHFILGPGSQNQLTLVVELYCPRCGISYHHLPGQGEEDEASRF